MAEVYDFSQYLKRFTGFDKELVPLSPPRQAAAALAPLPVRSRRTPKSIGPMFPVSTKLVSSSALAATAASLVVAAGLYGGSASASNAKPVPRVGESVLYGLDGGEAEWQVVAVLDGGRVLYLRHEDETAYTDSAEVHKPGWAFGI